MITLINVMRRRIHRYTLELWTNKKGRALFNVCAFSRVILSTFPVTLKITDVKILAMWLQLNEKWPAHSVVILFFELVS